MARREFQMPNVLRHEDRQAYWYIRYRRKVLVGKNQIERKEVWRRLGDCQQITKRQAMRLRDEIIRDVNREVYTITVMHVGVAVIPTHIHPATQGL